MYSEYVVSLETSHFEYLKIHGHSFDAIWKANRFDSISLTGQVNWLKIQFQEHQPQCCQSSIRNLEIHI